MSKIAIKGNESGTATFTIEAPATNTDRIFELPDEAGKILTDVGVPMSAMPAGSVIQVVSVTKTDVFSTTSSSLVDVTGLSATITPTSATSKIIVLVKVTGGTSDTTGTGFSFRLMRGSTAIILGPTGTTFTGAFAFSQRVVGTQNLQTSGVDYLDSPSTTSSTTYKIQGQVPSGTGYVNRSGGNELTGVSTITLMEIAG